MADFLDTLAQTAKRTVESGYYQAAMTDQTKEDRGCGLKESIIKCKKNAIITEFKLSSPSRNMIIRNADILDTVSAMKRGRRDRNICSNRA